MVWQVRLVALSYRGGKVFPRSCIKRPTPSPEVRILFFFVLHLILTSPPSPFGLAPPQPHLDWEGQNATQYPDAACGGSRDLNPADSRLQSNPFLVALDMLFVNQAACLLHRFLIIPLHFLLTVFLMFMNLTTLTKTGSLLVTT